mgnify:CR=1 FL=1
MSVWHNDRRGRLLTTVAGGFALLVGCEAEFYGDLGEVGRTRFDRLASAAADDHCNESRVFHDCLDV